MNITDNDITVIEQAIGIKLYNNQKKYILHDDESGFTDSGQGKTLAHMIKLALSEGEPLVMKRFEGYTDLEIHNGDYTSLYKREFIKIWHKLSDVGLTIRGIQ